MRFFARRFLVQGRQDAGILQLQVGQARGQGQGRGEAGPDRGYGRQHQAYGQTRAAAPAAGWIMENEAGHSA